MKKIILTLALVPILAIAQTTNLDQALTQLAQISTSDQVMARVKQIFAHDEARFSPNCQTITSGQLASISILEEPTFNAEGLPTAGHWLTRYELNVCDNQRIRAIDFRVNNNGLEMASLLPGNTQADPKLQEDVTKAFKMALLRAFPDCNTPFIADTNLLSLPENGAAPWEELWVANACGNLFSQAIKFAPQEDGTTAFALDIPTS